MCNSLDRLLVGYPLEKTRIVNVNAVKQLDRLDLARKEMVKNSLDPICWYVSDDVDNDETVAAFVWRCGIFLRQLTDVLDDTEFRYVVYHEIAHLIHAGSGHSNAWFTTASRLGDGKIAWRKGVQLADAQLRADVAEFHAKHCEFEADTVRHLANRLREAANA
jgi:hypothetical protein